MAVRVTGLPAWECEVFARRMPAWTCALSDTEVAVRLTISQEDFDVNRLDARVRPAREKAGREL